MADILKQIDKISYSIKWFSCKTVEELPKNLRVTQVYCWLLSTDGKIVLVSKDREEWQFPGGHPLPEETDLKETLVREIKEETSLDVSLMEEKSQIFGYYIVKEFKGDKLVDQYIQSRFYLRLPFNSSQLKLNPEEKEAEQEKDKINEAGLFSLDEACNLIPWLAKTQELEEFRRLV